MDKPEDEAQAELDADAKPPMRVVSLAEKREEMKKRAEQSQPHTEGGAKCTNCGHKWRAVAPAGVIDLECPACHELRGIFEFNCSVSNDFLFVCVCGRDLFQVKPDGLSCVCCGRDTSFEDLFDA